jgi:hypothetical protein
VRVSSALRSGRRRLALAPRLLFCLRRRDGRKAGCAAYGFAVQWSASMPGEAPGWSTQAAGAAVPEEIAQVAAAWRSLRSALVPVIGERGAAALVERSIDHAARQLPWLQPAVGAGGIAAVERTLAQRSRADLQAAHAAFLEAFVQLLEHLVGRELAQRLLEADERAADADDHARRG